MDASFEFLLPATCNLESLGFSRKVKTWGTETLQSDSLHYNFGNTFELKTISNYNFSFLKDLTPLEETTWIPIELEGDGIDLFVGCLFSLKNEELGFTFEDVLNSFLGKQEKWIFIFSPQSDGFNRIIKGGVSDILVNLKHEILNNQIGFLIYKS